MGNLQPRTTPVASTTGQTLERFRNFQWLRSIRNEHCQGVSEISLQRRICSVSMTHAASHPSVRHNGTKRLQPNEYEGFPLCRIDPPALACPAQRHKADMRPTMNMTDACFVLCAAVPEGPNLCRNRVRIRHIRRPLNSLGFQRFVSPCRMKRGRGRPVVHVGVQRSGRLHRVMQ